GNGNRHLLQVRRGGLAPCAFALSADCHSAAYAALIELTASFRDGHGTASNIEDASMFFSRRITAMAGKSLKVWGSTQKIRLQAAEYKSLRI
ncbi:hypothetical protein U2088_15445, partial [Listeria monocytogenes]